LPVINSISKELGIYECIWSLSGVYTVFSDFGLIIDFRTFVVQDFQSQTLLRKNSSSHHSNIHTPSKMAKSCLRWVMVVWWWEGDVALMYAVRGFLFVGDPTYVFEYIQVHVFANICRKPQDAGIPSKATCVQ